MSQRQNPYLSTANTSASPSSAIMHLYHLPAVLSTLALTTALPAPIPSSNDKPLPLIIWHGLGDNYAADGLHSTGELAAKVHPGTYVYYVRVDDDSSKDRSGSFFGNITAQSEDVCDAIKADPKLVDGKTGRVRADALGFSQGGQFLRGLVERCEGLDVRSLVTFGSQHNGIAKFQECGTFDLLCKGASKLVGDNAWTDYVQRTVVPAQYFRETNETTGKPTEGYLEHSHFLADINNERKDKNETYAQRIAKLEKFAMYTFEEDTTVVPKESGWFADVNATSGEITHLRDRPIYKEEWLGLKSLDEKGGLVFKGAPGKHMELDSKVLKEAFTAFFGPERKPSAVVDDVEHGVLRLVYEPRTFMDAVRSSFGSGRRKSGWHFDL